MKIGFITQNFPPETSAGAKRAMFIANSLTGFGDVTVTTLQPSYPKPEIYSAEETVDFDKAQQYRIIRSKPFFPHKSQWIRRGYEEVTAMRSLYRPVSKGYDLLVATSPSMFAGLYPALLSGSTPFLWDIRDLTWKYAEERIRAAVYRPVVYALQRTMSHALTRASGITTISQGMTDLLKRETNLSQVFTIPNGLDDASFHSLSMIPLEEKSRARPRIMYVGLLGHMQAPETFIAMARLLPEAEVHIVGDGPKRSSMEKTVKSEQLTNVVFHGYTRGEDLVDLYRDADVLVGQVLGTPTLQETALPTKIFEYMSTGKKFVFGCTGYARKFLTSYGMPTTNPGDPVEMTKAVSRLLQHSSCAKFGHHTRTIVEENYLRSHQDDAMRDAVRNVLET